MKMQFFQSKKFLLQLFSSQDKPKLWLIFLSILITWVISFLLALIPLLSELETTFSPHALIRNNPFFDNVVVEFNDARSWAEKTLTYDPWFSSQNHNLHEAAMKLQTANSYSELQAALGGARSAKYLETTGLFG